MTPQDEKTLTTYAERLTRPVDIRLFLSDDPRGQDLQAFCRRLGEMLPAVRTLEDTEETGSLPAIRIGERLRFRGVPSGNELEPFLEALCLLDTDSPPETAALPDELKALETPADLQIFVAPFCGFCPAVVRRLLPLPFAAESIYLTVVDAGMFPEIAEAHKIKSVPTLVLDELLRWTGMVDIGELARAAANRDPATLSSESLGRILQAEGGAYELADMMHRYGSVFPAFVSLLTDERFSIRLAAMVAVEELQSRDGNLALQVVSPMLDRYDHAPTAVKGDFLYLFGQLGATEALPLLQQAMEDPDAEIREAAAEALETIKQQ